MSYFSDKKVLVAGCAGLLGMSLVKKLREQTSQIRAVYHTNPPFNFYSDVEYINADLTQSWACQAVLKDIDIVYMCASVVAGAAGMSDSKVDLITPNVIMNCQMLRTAYENGIQKFVFYGSTTCYPEAGDKPMKEEELFDGDPYEKYFDVGWVKRYGIKLCETYSKKGLPCVVLIPSNIYGPYDKFNPDKSHVTPALIKKVVEKQNPLEVWGDGSEERDLIYVDDMTEASLLATKKIHKFDIINIGVGECYTVDYILNSICELEGFCPEIVYNRDKPTMISKRALDITKAQNLLKFKPKTSLKDGLQKTIEWYKENLYVSFR